MSNYRNSTTYRQKLTKDDKRDTNETNYKCTKTINKQNKKNIMVGKLIKSTKENTLNPEKNNFL